MIFKKALGDLWARKLRTVLVVLSIAVGVFGLSSIRILGEQIERGAVEKFATSNPADLTVDSTATSTAKRDRVLEVDNVQSIQGRVAGTARWKPRGGGTIETFAIVTTDAAPGVQPIHDRMPVIVTPENEEAWLAGSVEEAAAMLKPYGADVGVRAVSRVVSDPRNEIPECLDDAEPTSPWHPTSAPEMDACSL